MIRSNSVRGRVIVVSLVAGMLLAGTLVLSLQPDDEQFSPSFASDDGFQTQGPSEFAEGALTVVQQTADAYVEQLEVVQEFTTFDGSFSTPLADVAVHVDGADPNSTSVSIGDTHLTVEGLLTEVPVDEVQGELEAIHEEGWRFIGDTTEPGDDPEEPEPEPGDGSLYRLGDDDNTYAVIWLDESSGNIELIVLQTGDFDGIHIVANAWFVSHHDNEGTVLDLWVRNPFQVIETGAFHPSVTLQDITCADGQCHAQKEIQSICSELDPICTGSGTITIPTGHEGGHVEGMPGTILHVWSHDAIMDGSGINILDTYEAALAGPTWQGDPFGPEGMWVAHDGNLVATLQIQLPSATHPGVSIEVGGPAVDALYGDEVGADVEFEGFSLDIAWGPIQASSDDIYGQFDPLSAAFSTLWADASGTVHAARVSHLASGETLLDLAPEQDGDIKVTAGPYEVSWTEEGASIQPLPAGLDRLGRGVTGPISNAILQLVDLADQHIIGEVRAIPGGLGCSEDDPRGCLGVVYDSATTAADGAIATLDDAGVPVPLPTAPDIPGGDPEHPDLGIDGHEVVDATRFVQWVNGAAGTVLGYVPDPASCPGLDGITVDQCLASAPGPHDADAIVVGLLGAAGDGIAFLPDQNEDIIHVYDGDGQTLLRANDGELTVAGSGVVWGQHLVTLTMPDGRQTCVTHTLAVPSFQQDRWPSFTVGCSGIAGQSLTMQPGASYLTGSDGSLDTFTVYDPAEPGSYLLYYHDDGDNTTISSAAGPVGTHQFPSTLVHMSGSPLFDSNFRIRLAGHAISGGEAYSEIAVAKQVYSDGRAVASGTPAGSELEVLFELLEGPPSTVSASDGHGDVDEPMDGSDWLSGLRDHTVRASTDSAQAPERLDVVYEIGTPPTHGTSAEAELSLLGTSDGTRSYRGTIPSADLANANEGAELYFALAWTDTVGPVAFTRWDDHDGAHYRYMLDTKSPSATVTSPTSSDEAIFSVGWDAWADQGSGLGVFHIETTTGDSVPGAWIPWIDGRPADEDRHAQYSGTPGETHWFRARACDATGNCGPWSPTTHTTVAAAAAPDGAGPSIQVRAPTEGAVLRGDAALAWSIGGDGDGLVNVHHRHASGQRWHPIYSGSDDTATWDTTKVPNGRHELRFTATDGTHETQLVRHVEVTNPGGPGLGEIRAAHGSKEQVQGDPNMPAPVHGDDHGEGAHDEHKDSPGLGAAALVIGVMALLMGARRRR